ncbi:ParB/RepB/Spo0J family partition protein [Ligaoa zhengdingensis]|uniref:ParB/RepB/Spo0J family partition protein n=1 Tax=Ligaoa zhengdingensis TaxID=2763658 RepID=UPI0031B9D11A
MLININDIKINPGRRKAVPEDVQRLSESIAEIGMMNPITVDANYTLVAGLHRLEAAKRLDWTEVECAVCELDGLHAELAEIDENVIRTGLSDLELSELLARRKKIYEALHPATIARNLPGHASNYESSSDKLTGKEKPFSQDTAEKMGVSPRTVERHIQIGENLTPETKEILRSADTKITKQNLTKLSRLEPEQQTEAAKRLTEGTIKSVDEYTAEGTAIVRESNYYCTGAFIVDSFSEQNDALSRVPEAYKLRLEHYREILSSEQIKAMIGIAEDSIKLLEDYIAFLNNELEVSE